MRRFLIGWILIVLLLPFAAAWIYSEWSEKNKQIEQESSQLQIDVQTVSGVKRMGTSDFLIGAIAGPGAVKQNEKRCGELPTKRIMTESVRRSGKRTGRFCILKAGR